MKNSTILLGIILFVSCAKNEVPLHFNSDSDINILLREEIKSETRKLSTFIDRYIKSSNIVKNSPSTAPMEEAVDEYIEQELSPQEALAIEQYVNEVSPYFYEFATANETLPLLSEVSTEFEAVNLLKDNFRQSTNIANAIPTNDNTLKSVINSLHEEINDEIENDLANAYLVDDEEMSEAQIETLYESDITLIKNKISNKVIGFNNGLLINSRGLTVDQVNFIGITAMVALEAIDDLVLLENLEAAISENLDLDEPVDSPSTKGLFKKIGKFFTKVVKTVAVVVTYVAVTALTIFNTALAVTESGYVSGSAGFKALIGVGTMIELGNTWKKTWNWVGWNDWSRW